MKPKLGALVVGLVAVVIIAALSLFVVDQRQNAIVFRLGEIVDIKTEPGLYFKVPVLDNVRYFDTRILTFDTAEPERFIAMVEASDLESWSSFGSGSLIESHRGTPSSTVAVQSTIVFPCA